MEIPTIVLPPVETIETISIPLPTADVPSYKMIIVPPSDLERPKDTEEIKTETPEPPKLEIPVLDIQLPLPTAEVVATATYAAVAAVATTTLATPFFDQIKKKLQKFIQGKIEKWKQKKNQKGKIS